MPCSHLSLPSIWSLEQHIRDTPQISGFDFSANLLPPPSSGLLPPGRPLWLGRLLTPPLFLVACLPLTCFWPVKGWSRRRKWAAGSVPGTVTTADCKLSGLSRAPCPPSWSPSLLWTTGSPQRLLLLARLGAEMMELAVQLSPKMFLPAGSPLSVVCVGGEEVHQFGRTGFRLFPFYFITQSVSFLSQ